MSSYTTAAYIFFDEMTDLIKEQAEWSNATFGDEKQRGPVGPLKHMAKEVCCELLGCDPLWFDQFVAGLQPRTYANAQQSITDIMEYADLLILLLDSSRRAGHSFIEVIRAGREKMQENMKREWPKFDPSKVNEAVEHIRKDGE